MVVGSKKASYSSRKNPRAPTTTSSVVSKV